ncbi:MAG: glycosyltransferase family 4 protein [Planctomycetota bacterium]
MRAILISALAAACGLSLVITRVVRHLSLRYGFVDEPGGRKKHERVTPQGGGVAIVLATSVTILAAAALPYLWHVYPGLMTVPETLAENMRLAARTLPLLVYILAGGLAIAFFGLWDDLRPFRPVTKLLCQFAIVTVIVVTSGIRVTLFIESDFLQCAVTVVWVVLLTNSFNLLDNMDGLSSILTVVCGGSLAILALQTGQFFVAGFVLCLVGAVFGFLFYNYPPASIFMGDTGSMFLGYMLATATTLTTFMAGPQQNPLFPALVPLIIFAVPLYDSASVVLIRLHHGRHLLAGDRNHLSHRLYRLGMSPGRVLATISLMAVATSLGATVPYGGPTWIVLVPVLQAGAALGVLLQLELFSTDVQYPG